METPLSLYIIGWLILLIVFSIQMMVLAWATSALWAAVVTKVPFVPTGWRVTRGMIELANIQPGETVYDLGCGEGRLLRAIAVPDTVRKGYEVVPTLVWWAKFRNWLRRDTVQYYRQDFFTVDLSDADVVFCYLFPIIMNRFPQEIIPQLKPGTRIVSHAFELPELEPEEQRKVGKHTVRLYRVGS